MRGPTLKNWLLTTASRRVLADLYAQEVKQRNQQQKAKVL